MTAEARGVNDAGAIVGFFTDSSGVDHGFLRDASGHYTVLDAAGATATQAFGINDSGEIVGAYNDASGVQHGFLFDGVHYTSYDVPGGSSTTIRGVDNNGDITGYYDNARGFALLANGTLRLIDVPGGDLTYPDGINDAGTVIGFYTHNGFHGFLADAAGGITTFDVPGATLTVGTGINDAGTFVGGYIAGGVGHGFLVVPEPPSIGLGLAGLVFTGHDARHSVAPSEVASPLRWNNRFARNLPTRIGRARGPARSGTGRMQRWWQSDAIAPRRSSATRRDRSRARRATMMRCWRRSGTPRSSADRQEASHGTHEFYEERARITRRLIEEKGFTAVCVEADWPDAPPVSIASSAALADDADMPSRRLGDFPASSRPGCGGTRTCSNSSAGSVAITTTCRAGRPGRSASTGSTCTASTPRSAP